MKNKPKKQSIKKLLIKNYLTFTILLAFTITLSAFAFFTASYHQLVDINSKEILNTNTILEQGKYDEFPVQNLLGYKGKIMVLDQDNNTIYNPENINLALNEEELRLIPDYLGNTQISIIETTTKRNKTNYIIVETNETEEKPHTYILDKDYNLIYATGDLITKDLTEKEFKLITNTTYQDLKLYKYNFNTKDNLPYTLLLFQNIDSENILIGRLIKISIDCLVIFIIIYVILVILFTTWMNKKISNPLTLLTETINNFKIGDPTPQHYQGPKEFTQIFQSFEAMSKRLQNTEHQKQELEIQRQKMLADIAHDLKTPITVIQGYAKALNDNIIPEEQIPTYIQIIQQKADGLNHLINTFYEYSKTSHPDYSPTLEKQNICNTLRDYVAEKYTEIEMQGYTLDIQIPEENIYCNIDKMQLKRVYDNIIQNAIKHTPKGTTILIKLTPYTHIVKITIADNGPGIPDNIKKTIFEPFTVGEESRQNQGSGLGLSIAKKIITAHSGTIILNPQPTKPYTTQFEIKIPKIIQ